MTCRQIWFRFGQTCPESGHVCDKIEVQIRKKLDWQLLFLPAPPAAPVRRQRDVGRVHSDAARVAAADGREVRVTVRPHVPPPAVPRVRLQRKEGEREKLA